jgi:hypothetical protein
MRGRSYRRGRRNAWPAWRSRRFLAALLRAERLAANAFRSLLERLAAGPSPGQWRDVIAGVLDDPALRLAYHDPSTAGFVSLTVRSSSARSLPRGAPGCPSTEKAGRWPRW